MQKASIKNTAVILPVYNSSRHLKKLIPKVLEYFPKTQIFAIDDGSQDDSANICIEQDIELISYNQNMGKGYALNRGMQKAIEMGYEYAICMDSDEQHDPTHLMEFIAKQNSSNAGLIIGSRSMTTKDMPFPRICSNKLTSLIVSLTCRQKVIDSQCGYILYRLEDIKGLSFKTQRYQFETEILLKLAKKKVKIDHIPIKTIYGDETSHISHLRDISNFVKVVVASWFEKGI